MIVSIWLLYIIARRYGDCLLKCNTLAATMGNSCSCWKKQTANGQAPARNNNNDGSATRAGDRRISGGNPGPSAHHVNEPHAVQGHSANGAQIRVHQRKRDRSQIDGLVKETLELIRTLVDNDQEPPRAMLTLHRLADKENGWLAVVQSLIRVIPMNDPLGPAVVILLLDECPLPSKEAISRLCTSLKLSETPASVVSKEVCRHRNICVVLGCLAEKMAGPSSVSLLTEDILQYLLGNLDISCDPAVILHSLVALEKFAQTSENKSTINAKIKEYEANPIIDLEVWRSSDNYSQREVGFCATWLLDNLFIAEGRSYSYENVDNSGLNAILNSNDVSEYLKIAPSGLEARCDASSFESVRCTFQVDSDVWYYEVHIITAGVMQIGFATRDSKFLNYEGYGIGDDEYSIAYDGCRQLLWYNAESQPHTHPRWKPGDVLGLLLDLDSHKVIFSLNGQALPQHTEVFNNARSRFFAAASFMSFQQCEFNFGHRDFSYPPKVAYKKFNDYGSLSPEERIILPRLKRVEQFHHVSVPEDSCTICCENQANVTLLPCEHSGVCMTCAVQLELCPMCREPISTRKEDS